MLADALLRRLAMAWSKPNIEWLKQHKVVIDDDSTLKEIMLQCLTHNQQDKNYSVRTTS